MTRFSSLSAPARHLWAKSGDGSGHGVLAHLLDVAAVTECIVQHEPPSSLDWAAQVFGVPREHVARWIACLVGLHDFGKAIPGFQDKWPAGRQADEALGLQFPARSLSVTDHACASGALLAGVPRACGDEPKQQDQIVGATECPRTRRNEPLLERIEPSFPGVPPHPFAAPRWDGRASDYRRAASGAFAGRRIRQDDTS